MAVPDPDEMEEFQKLSDQYRPNLEGPLIGDKLPMIELVTEYAQADPTFVAKTQALANSYNAWRRIKGDGQCGWRGTVFGYFEILLKSSDLGLVQQELIRIQSYADVMKNIGMDYDLLQDMFEYTFDLFADIQKAIETDDTTEAILTKFFNDENISNSIVYHFKTMTSAHMAANPDLYEPFLEMPLNEYRQLRIDPANQEIDQIGLQALSNGVIALGGVGIEVLYLDRSAGDVVTPHNFAPDLPAHATIRLLYRPGHYDIIYRPGSAYLAQPPRTSQPVTAFPVTSISQDWMYDNSNSYNMFQQAALGQMSWVVPDDSYYHHIGDLHEEPYQSRPAPRNYSGELSAEYMHAYAPQYEVAHSSPLQHRTLEHAFSPVPQLHPPMILPPSSMPVNSASPQPYASVSSGSTSGEESGDLSSGSGLQIRYNENMYNSRRQISIPYDPNSIRSTADQPNSIASQQFDPEQYDPATDFPKR